MTSRTRPARGYARTAILSATLAIIAADGLDAVTHRRVAEVAGVSPGSTTHHFSSREDLIGETFRFYLQMASRFMAAVDDEIRPSTSDPLERVRRFATEIIHREFEPGGQNIRAEHEMLLYASSDDDLAAQVRGWDARWVGHIAGDLEAAGWSRPVDAARTIINLIRGFEIERLIDPQVDTDDFQRRLEAVLVRADF
jgi:AcrR family transcriptional regulator